MALSKRLVNTIERAKFDGACGYECRQAGITNPAAIPKMVEWMKDVEKDTWCPQGTYEYSTKRARQAQAILKEAGVLEDAGRCSHVPQVQKDIVP